MAKIVLVANGPFRDMGKKIDSHDVVIRMGAGYLNRNNDSGYKTDIWAFRGGTRELKRIKFPDEIECWNFDKRKGNMGGKHYIQRGYDEVKGSPTLGWMTLMAALDRLKPPFSIVGYSFLKKGRHHYWADYRVVGFSHPVENEKACIEKMVDEGKLEWLRRS